MKDTLVATAKAILVEKDGAANNDKKNEEKGEKKEQTTNK